MKRWLGFWAVLGYGFLAMIIACIIVDLTGGDIWYSLTYLYCFFTGLAVILKYTIWLPIRLFFKWVNRRSCEEGKDA